MRIVHFTDIHVTERPSNLHPSELLSKRLLGWVNLAFRGRYEVFREAPAIVRAFLDDIGSLHADWILSTGDLTGLSLPSEFGAARKVLAPLLEDQRVLGIPGNHDVYVRAAVRDRLYERYFGEWTRTDFSPDDFPPSLRPLFPYPLVRFLAPKVALVALRDVFPTRPYDSGGAVTPMGLEGLLHVLTHSRLKGSLKLVALHCGPCRAGGRPDKRLHGLHDWPALLEVLRVGNARFVLHGHIHQRFVVENWRGASIHVLNPGSLTSNRHDRAYHVLDVEDQVVRLRARRFDEATGRFVEWHNAPGAGDLLVS